MLSAQQRGAQHVGQTHWVRDRDDCSEHAGLGEVETWSRRHASLEPKTLGRRLRGWAGVFVTTKSPETRPHLKARDHAKGREMKTL